MNHQLGLVLSGGGVRGAAHAGVIKALEEENIEVDCISGTSAGAVAGVLYAAGYKAEDILQFFIETKIFQLSNFTFLKPGLLDSKDYAVWLNKYLNEVTFDSLDKPLFVAVTNLLLAEYEIFDSGPVVPVIQASAAVPIIFTPVEIGEGLYADGGVLNNFPIEPLLGRCKHILGVNVNPLKKAVKQELDGVFDVLERVYHISTRYETALKVRKCDWLIQPDELLQFNIFDMDKAEEAFEIGYREALGVIERMK